MRVLRYPDPHLRLEAKPVGEVDDGVRLLVRDMLETMYAAKGIGLSAPQVGVGKRVVVADVSPDRSEPRSFVNPVVAEAEGKQRISEGCLSFPGHYAKVSRAEKIRVDALDVNGYLFSLEAEGLLAVCIQHEIDHLDGRLFIDHLTMTQRQRIRKAMAKRRTK